MEMGWLFGEKNGQPLDNQHYVQDAPGGHKEPRKTKDEMKGRLGWFPKPVTVSRKKWSSRGQWGRPASNDRRSTAETELNTTVS